MAELNEQKATGNGETEVAELVKASGLEPLELFKNTEVLVSIFDAIRIKAKEQPADVSTAKGRAAIASTARKVSSSKVFIDNIGKEVCDKIRSELDLILENRKWLKTGLDSLRDEIRNPLNEWEAADAKRCADHQENIKKMRDVVNRPYLDREASGTLKASLDFVTNLAALDYEEFAEAAKQAADASIAVLKIALAAAIDREEEYLIREAEAKKLAEEKEAEAQRLEAARLEVEKTAQALKDAQEKAERLKNEAKAEADRIKAEAETEKAKLLAEIEALRAQIPPPAPVNYGPFEAETPMGILPPMPEVTAESPVVTLEPLSQPEETLHLPRRIEFPANFPLKELGVSKARANDVINAAVEHGIVRWNDGHRN